MGERKSYSVRLKPDIFKSVKFLAVKEDKTISALFEEGIQDLLKKYEKKGAGKKG